MAMRRYEKKKNENGIDTFDINEFKTNNYLI